VRAPLVIADELSDQTGVLRKLLESLPAAARERGLIVLDPATRQEVAVVPPALVRDLDAWLHELEALVKEAEQLERLRIH
jgi:hypothetical protein